MFWSSHHYSSCLNYEVYTFPAEIIYYAIEEKKNAKPESLYTLVEKKVNFQFNHLNI